jgi:TolA-binding protein
MEEEKEKKSRKKQESGEEWNKKGVFIAGFFLIVILLAGIEAKNFFFKDTNVLGKSSGNVYDVDPVEVQTPKVNVSSEVGSRIKDIKQNVNELNVEEVASSSPQIQKVLRDIQGIKDYPTNQAREACMKICSGL